MQAPTVAGNACSFAGPNGYLAGPSTKSTSLWPPHTRSYGTAQIPGLAWYPRPQLYPHQVPRIALIASLCLPTVGSSQPHSIWLASRSLLTLLAIVPHFGPYANAPFVEWSRAGTVFNFDGFGVWWVCCIVAAFVTKNESAQKPSGKLSLACTDMVMSHPRLPYWKRSQTFCNAMPSISASSRLCGIFGPSSTIVDPKSTTSLIVELHMVHNSHKIDNGMTQKGPNRSASHLLG